MRPIDPDLLGPLDSSAPSDERWLSASEAKKRAALWTELAPRIEKICAPDEKVIYVARAYRAVTLGMHFGLGWLAPQYFQVALVFTNRRMIEALLTFGGRGPETATRSFPWEGVAELRFGGLRGLTLVGRDGKRHRFMARTRGDRRVLKLLAPRITEKLLLPSAVAPSVFPVEHCPACYTPFPAGADSCPACRSLARSAKLASWLSLAIPGGGLAYVGHPVLALFDFLGEAVLFLVIGVGLAQASSTAEIVGLLVATLLLGTLTKVESVHVGRILAARRRTDTPERRDRFRALGKVGAAVTILAVLGAGAATGRFAPKGHDLDFSAASGWTGSRSRADWKVTANYDHPRSEWTHEGGLVVSVSSIPNTHVTDVAAFQDELTQVLEKGGQLGTLLSRSALPGGLAGFEHAWKLPEERGAFVVCYVVDGSDGGVQQIHSVVPLDLEEEAS